MKYLLTFLLTILMFGTTIGQTVEPPMTNDEFGWLRWAVIVLCGIVVSGSGVFFAYMKNAQVERIKDKDSEIDNLRELLRCERLYCVEIQKEKDVLHKDIQDKVIPSLVTASNLIQSLIKK